MTLGGGCYGNRRIDCYGNMKLALVGESSEMSGKAHLNRVTAALKKTSSCLLGRKHLYY